MTLIVSMPSSILADASIYPISLAVKLEDFVLYWHIYWSDEVIEVVRAHGFHTGKCSIRKYVRLLFNNSDEPIALESHGKVNIRKNLAKVGFKGVLYDLFMVNESGTRAMLKTKCISLKNLPRPTVEKVVKLMSEYEMEKFIIEERDSKNSVD